MYMYRQQTKRHIETDLMETCINMYRDNVRNIHARACRGIYQGGQSSGTHVVISHVLFSYFARFKVRFTIIFLFFGGFQECHIVQSTQTRELFLMALKF